MDTRTLTVVKEAGGQTFTNILIADHKNGDHIAICQASDPPSFSQNNAAELVRRWNAYPELLAALDGVMREIDNCVADGSLSGPAVATNVNCIAARAAIANATNTH
jgi:hypothetical protein